MNYLRFYGETFSIILGLFRFLKILARENKLPAMESPRTHSGKTKNMRMRQATENQRYLAVVLPRNLAIGMGIRVAGIGKKSISAVILNSRWHREICRVQRSCWGSAASAAINDVVVVPMLEPSVSGYTRSKLITPNFDQIQIQLSSTNRL